MLYDLIIIGQGPAGLSAAIYAARYKLNFLVLGEIPGGLMSEAHKVCNYPSEIEIPGALLYQKMKANAEHVGAKLMMTKVTAVEKQADNSFLVKTEKEEYQTKTIILAAGTTHRRLDLPKEKMLVGKGLSYCATCDANFFKNKIVAVIGSGNSAMTASLHLADLAQKVYLIVRGQELRGEVVWMEQVKENEKIETVFETNIIELLGENKLSGIVLDKEYNGQKQIDLDGLFVEIGVAPRVEEFSNLNLELTEDGYIKVSGEQKTNQENIWAAGDITNGSNKFHQIVTACAEGAVAGNAVYKYIKGGK